MNFRSLTKRLPAIALGIFTAASVMNMDISKTADNLIKIETSKSQARGGAGNGSGGCCGDDGNGSDGGDISVDQKVCRGTVYAHSGNVLSGNINTGHEEAMINGRYSATTKTGRTYGLFTMRNHQKVAVMSTEEDNLSIKQCWNRLKTKFHRTMKNKGLNATGVVEQKGIQTIPFNVGVGGSAGYRQSNAAGHIVRSRPTRMTVSSNTRNRVSRIVASGSCHNNMKKIFNARNKHVKGVQERNKVQLWAGKRKTGTCTLSYYDKTGKKLNLA